jgi:hypothetical protein
MFALARWKEYLSLLRPLNTLLLHSLSCVVFPKTHFQFSYETLKITVNQRDIYWSVRLSQNHQPYLKSPSALHQKDGRVANDFLKMSTTRALYELGACGASQNADEAQVCAVLRWLRSVYKPLSSSRKYIFFLTLTVLPYFPKKKTCDSSMGDQKATGYAFMAVFSPSLSTPMKLTLEPKRNRKEPGLCACPSPLLKENSSFICRVEARAMYHKKRTGTLPCAALSWVYNLTFLQQAKDSLPPLPQTFLQNQGRCFVCKSRKSATKASWLCAVLLPTLE